MPASVDSCEVSTRTIWLHATCAILVSVCGRYTVSSTPEELAAYFGVEEVTTEAVEPSWNVAPSQKVLAIASSRDGQTRRLGQMSWGLVPSWAKDPKVGYRMINARAETLATSRSYRVAFSRRRCIIPADAFYEWQRLEEPKARKIPWAFQRADGHPMAFAGLWEIWRDPEAPEASPLRSCTIVTTSANSLMARVHHRMPVVLAPEGWRRWLDPKVRDPDSVADLLAPAPAEWFEAWPVTTKVNNVANDGPELLDPLPAPPV